MTPAPRVIRVRDECQEHTLLNGMLKLQVVACARQRIGGIEEHIDAADALTGLQAAQHLEQNRGVFPGSLGMTEKNADLVGTVAGARRAQIDAERQYIEHDAP